MAIFRPGSANASSGPSSSICPAPSSTNASAQGAGAINLGANTLTLGSNDASTTLSGVISGAGGALTKVGTGTLTLSGTNSYSGATTINAGTLVLSGTNTSSAITIASGATLAGTGSGGATTVSGTISPGNSPGILTVGDLTLNSGGAYTWEMADATGVAGTGWDQIVATGLLTVSSTSGSPFTIAITSSGAPSNWTYTNSGQTWDIIDYGTISGFDATKFSLTTGGFGGTTDAGSSWALSDTGSVLRLTYTYTAGTPTWSGGTGNWTAGFTPAISNGLNAIFTGAGGTATNNIASATLTNIGSITFNSTAGPYTLDANSGSSGFNAGSALTINGDITNNSTSTQTINLALNYAENENINANTGNLVIGGAVAIASTKTLTVLGANNTTISGIISGSGALTKNSSSSLTLSGANTFSGGSTVGQGTILIGDNAAFGTGDIQLGIAGVAASITLASNDSNARTISNGLSNFAGSTFNLTLGQASGGTGALTFSSTNSTALGSATRTFTVLNTTTFNGAFTGTASSALTKAGAGTLILNGANSYTGATTINAGTLNAAHASALGTTSSVTVNNGGSLLVSADDAINGRAITLASTSTTVAGLAFSGTFANTSGQAGTLTLSQNSILDLGTGSVVLHFSSITGLDTYTLSIYNWTGTTLWDGGDGNNTDQFYSNGTALTQSQLNRISFYSGGLGTSSFIGSGYQIIGGSFANEVIPVPEPETYATAVLLLLGGAFWTWRRRTREQGVTPENLGPSRCKV